MKNRFLPLVFALTLIAAACGSAADLATETVDEVVEPAVEDPDLVTTTETPPVETTTTEAAIEEVPAIAVDGQELYESNCARCHGIEGEGGRGPSLQGIAVEQPDQSAGIAQVVDGGGGMPAFGSRLSAEEVQSTIDYIWDTF